MELLHKMKLATKLYISFALILGFTAILGLNAIREINLINDLANDVRDKLLPSVRYLGTLNTITSDFRVVEMQHILSASKVDMDEDEKNLKLQLENFEKNRKLYETLEIIPQDRKIYDEFTKLWNLYLVQNQKVIELSRSFAKEDARALAKAESQKTFDDLSNKLLELIDRSVAATNAISIEGDMIFDAAWYRVMFIFLLATLISMLIATLILRNVRFLLGGEPREIHQLMLKIAQGDLNSLTSYEQSKGLLGALVTLVNQVRKVVSEVSNLALGLRHSSQELAASAQQVASNSDQMKSQYTAISASSEEITANVNSMAAAVEESVANTNNLTRNIQSIDKEINQVAKTMSELNRSLLQVNVSTQQAVKTAQQADDNAQASLLVMKELGQSAETIGGVVNLIDDISTQTKILALNATIEAASAGEAGKGFAVVAAEVKNLAQQTADANNEIGKQIQQIQQFTHQALNSTNVIHDVIVHVSTTNRDVATAMTKESNTAKEISKTVDSISSSSRISAINISENNSGLKQISMSINELAYGIKDVNANIHGIQRAISEINNEIKRNQKQAQELSQISSQLNNSISYFKIQNQDRPNIALPLPSTN